MRSVALIIANDPGEGFAGPKYLASLRGTPLIERVLADAATWPVDEAVLVLGPDAEAILSGADLGDATVVIDPEWKEGLAASLRVGVDVIERSGDVDRLVIANADQPGVGADTVAQLLAALADHRAAVPKYRYRRGWPVALSSDLGDLLLRLEGPVDLHDLIESHVSAVREVWIDRLEPGRVLAAVDLGDSGAR